MALYDGAANVSEGRAGVARADERVEPVIVRNTEMLRRYPNILISPLTISRERTRRRCHRANGSVNVSVDVKIACWTCRTVVLANVSNVSWTGCIGLPVTEPTNSINVRCPRHTLVPVLVPNCSGDGKLSWKTMANHLLGCKPERYFPGSRVLLCIRQCVQTLED